MRDGVQGRDVLKALYEGCEGVVELRALPRRVSGFFVPTDADAIAAFLKQHATDNLFWGVSTRRDATGGALSNCLHLGAIFVDLDDRQGVDADALERRRTLPFRPSVVVRSGGGEHWYFLLREPLDLQNPSDVTLAYDVLRRLSGHVAGDVAVAEPARILRVPTTVNHKYTPPRVADVRQFTPDLRYNASELRDWLPATTASTGAAVPVDLSKPVREERNRTLYRLGRGLKGKGIPAPVLAETIAFVNTRCCKPPLEDWEITQIVTHVLQQPDRPRSSSSASLSRTISIEVS